ncbi:MAG: TRAP transporter TatT component family protein [Spirochaetia bacterium]
MRTGRAARPLCLTAALVFAVALSSCSTFAVHTVAGFLAGSGQSTVFTGEDDPELARDALPFAMKTYESLLEADPRNAPLALATGRAFAGYAFAFVQAPSDQLPLEQVEEQRAMHQRAKKLFLRARDYVLQGLEIRRPGFTAALNREGVQAALRLTRKEDSDYLYWAAAAWLGAFGADPFDFVQIVAVPRAVAMLQQVDAWDDAYGAGAVHEIFISFYGGAPADLGGGEQKARASFARALALSKGMRAGPYIALATSVSVKNQDAAEFRELLGKALAIDVNADIPDRLVNIINQRKARWLLDHVDDYFLADEGGE